LSFPFSEFIQKFSRETPKRFYETANPLGTVLGNTLKIRAY